MVTLSILSITLTTCNYALL